MNKLTLETGPAQAAPCPVDIALLRDTVGMCAFAIEARRVLDEVSCICDHCPSIKSVLTGRIEAMNDYGELPFPVSDLLLDAHKKLDALMTWESDLAGSA